MTRRAWAWVLAGYVVMAVGFTVFAFVLANQVDQNRSTVKRLDATQIQLRSLACQLDAHVMPTEQVTNSLCNR